MVAPMRDHVLLVLTLALSVIAAGCGPSGDGSSQPQQAQAPAPRATDAGAAKATPPGAAGNLQVVLSDLGRSVNPDNTMHDATILFIPTDDVWARSEERRVGKECRSRWEPYH